MDIQVATIADIQVVARREALNAGRKALGVTVASPRYVSVPNEQEEDAVLEFVVDVFLLDSASQAVSFLGDGAGLRRLNNVLVATTAVGDLIADINTPVEIELSRSGQLQVTGRAKITLPTVRLDWYTLQDLGILHVAELTKDDAGVLRDAFGVPYNGSAVSKPSVSTTNSMRLSTLGELVLADNLLTPVSFGQNQLQRTIVTIVRALGTTHTDGVTVADRRS